MVLHRVCQAAARRVLDPLASFSRRTRRVAVRSSVGSTGSCPGFSSSARPRGCAGHKGRSTGVPTPERISRPLAEYAPAVSGRHAEPGTSPGPYTVFARPRVSSIRGRLSSSRGLLGRIPRPPDRKPPGCLKGQPLQRRTALSPERLLPGRSTPVMPAVPLHARLPISD